MTTRVSELGISRNILNDVISNRKRVNDLSEQISSGIKVSKPGDSLYSGTIAQYRQSLDKINGYANRVTSVKNILAFQDNALAQANDLIIEAKELAVQAANEPLGSSVRDEMAQKIFQLRDHLVSLANSKYQGRYMFGGADDDDPPYDAQSYTNPATGSASQRYVYDAEDGTDITRSVNITDDLTVTVNTPGNQIFDNAIQALERLGRAVDGFKTTPSSGAPDGGGTAYTFPDELSVQTRDIQSTIDQLEVARTQDIIPEQVDVAGRERRLDTAEALLQLTVADAETALASLQNVDIAQTASQLTQAQTILEASFAVSAKILNQTILDYL